MGISYRKGYERGAWYDLKVLREHMEIRQAKGADVSWYLEIYKSWIKDPEYKKADQRNINEGLYKALE